MLRVSRATVAAMMLGLLGCRTGAPDSATVLKSNGVSVGDVRGTALINKLIRIRILDAGIAANFAFEIERVAGLEIYNMRALLGQFVEGGAQTEFRGGEPNPFGLLLWHQLLARFTRSLAGTCGSQSPMIKLQDQNIVMSSSFFAKLKAACTTDGDPAARQQAGAGLWRAVLGPALPGEEQAFSAFFAQSGAAPAEERVAEMLLAMTLNPYFLLEK